MNTDEYSYEDAWRIIDAFMNTPGGNPIIRHQISSYNRFIEHGIDAVIQDSSPIVQNQKEEDGTQIVVIMNFSHIRIKKPMITETNGFSKPMTPNEARLRNDTYSAQVELDVKILTKVIDPHGGESFFPNEIPRVSIGKIPIMIGSKACILKDILPEQRRELGECYYDDGGYFIINGGERAIVSQEMIAENQLFIFPGGRSGKQMYLAELKSAPENKEGFIRGYSIKMMKSKHGPCLRINIPRVRQDVPFTVILRALGIETDKAIVERTIGPNCDLTYQRLLEPSIIEGFETLKGDLTQEGAFDYLIKYSSIGIQKLPKEDQHRAIRKVLHEDVLPHLGDSFNKKAWFVSYSANEILKCHTGERNFDDRDSYNYKRVELAGHLLTRLFFQYWCTKIHRDIRAGMNKEFNSGSWQATKDYSQIVNATNIFKLIKTTTIDAGLKQSLATGNFGMKNANGKVGVSQVLARLNRNGTISHLRRISSPVDKSGKLVAPRKLHPTSWGFVCPSETPEGESVGVVKNMSSTTLITTPINSAFVHSVIRDLIINKTLGDGFLLELMDNQHSNFFHTFHRIWINGNLIGIIENGVKLLLHLLQLRRKTIIHPMVSIFVRGNNVVVFTDGGRMLRPVLRLKKNGKLVISRDTIQRKDFTWENLFMPPKVDKSNKINIESPIDYIDANETESALILMAPKFRQEGLKYTHMEIHPSTVLGTMASMIPFPDHNQAPRNTYQSAMGKQAMGIYATNFLERMDTIGNVLSYPQRPLAYTRMDKYYRNTSMPNGLNAVIAIMSLNGYNQEDSVLMSREAIDRGLFRSFFQRTYRDEEKKNADTGEEEKFCAPHPQKTEGMRHGNQTKLNDDGFIPENTPVDGNDVIIGKVTPLKGTKKGVVGLRKMNVQNEEKQKDLSKAMRPNEKGRIDKVHIDVNGDGYRFVKVRVRSEKIPVIGDKFCIKENSFILTHLGWVKFKDIDIEKHSIATLQPGDVLDYVTPSNKYVFHCKNEKLYSMTSNHVKMVCTDNHNIYAKTDEITGYRFIKAKNIHGQRVSQKKNCRIDLIQKSKYEESIEIKRYFWHEIDDELEFDTLQQAEKQQIVALRCGMSATISKSTSHFGKFIVRFVKDKGLNEPTVSKEMEGCEEKWIHQTGKVGCIEVPGTHLFYYKDDEFSPPCWTGNSSRHGQKGTCGLILPAGDMPFTSSGIQPDIIINPHAIPSRMTIAQLVECVMGKEGCMTGRFVDATPFQEFDIHSVGNQLENFGMEKWGNEVMFSGITGEQMDCNIFIGPTFQQRLKHMVDDKIHSRASGPVVMLTRQPAEGRSRDGGLRFGEMERDCIISHGMTQFLKERMLDVSDKFPVHISKFSGLITAGNPVMKRQKDLVNSDNTDFANLQIPAAMKLFMQEMETMGIQSRLLTN